jgi:hypothetical protein
MRYVPEYERARGNDSEEKRMMITEHQTSPAQKESDGYGQQTKSDTRTQQNGSDDDGRHWDGRHLFPIARRKEKRDYV